MHLDLAKASRYIVFRAALAEPAGPTQYTVHSTYCVRRIIMYELRNLHLNGQRKCNMARGVKVVNLLAFHYRSLGMFLPHTTAAVLQLPGALALRP